MGYCSNCGSKLQEGVKFCPECGTKIINTDGIKRDQVFQGTVHKCPNCGEVLDSFDAICPACGYEFRDVEANDSVKELEKKISEIESTREKTKRFGMIFSALANDKASDTDIKIINLVKSFPIPNTKEDIMEFMILASSNIDYDAYDQSKGGLLQARQEVSNAWVSKLEQAYSKAKITFKDEPEFVEMEKLYCNSKKRIKNSKSRLWKLMAILWGFVLLIWVVIFLIAKFS